MLTEKSFEDIICKHPELIEDGLSLKGRQIRVYGKIMDVLFEDKFGQKLIVELKIGPIDRKHIGQVMEYEGGVLSIEDPTARIMLVGNRVPPNLKKALDHHGIEWKEISPSQLKDFLKTKNDTEYLNLLNDQQQELVFKGKRSKQGLLKATTKITNESPGVWIFQSNPKWYRLLDKLKSGNNKETWRIMRFKKEIKKGDIILFWIAGQNAGIYATGIVDSEPTEMHADKETAKFCSPEYARAYPIAENICTRVWVKFTKKFIDKPILKNYLLHNDILKTLHVIKQPQGTNFRVTVEQWDELKKYSQLSGLARNGIMEDSEQIDWNNPDSHLSLIENQNALDRINYIRKKIKEISKNIVESGRQSWMEYRIFGKGRRPFAAIGEIRKNGRFTVSVGLPRNEIKLNGYESKDWGSGTQRNKSTIITFEPTVTNKDIESELTHIKCYRT